MDEYVTLNFNEIFEDIRAHLTGEQRADIPYLIKQRERYKDLPGAAEMVSEIARMINELLPDNVRAEFAAIHHEQRRRWDTLFKDASDRMHRGDLSLAEQILRNLAEQASETPDRDVVYYDFQDQIERLYVLARGEEKRNVKDAPFPLMGVYQLLCAVLLQANRLEEALQAADEAVGANLVAIMPRIERTYCLQRLGRWQELLDSLIEAFPLCWKPIHFSEWYRAVTPWFFHAADFEGFGVCLLLSQAVMEDEEKKKLLEIAGQLSGISYDSDFAERVPQLARERKIPLHPEPLWCGLAMSLAKQYLESEDLDEAFRYLTIAYDVNRTPELKEQIERLHSYIEETRLASKVAREADQSPPAPSAD